LICILILYHYSSVQGLTAHLVKAHGTLVENHWSRVLHTIAGRWSWTGSIGEQRIYKLKITTQRKKCPSVTFPPQKQRGLPCVKPCGQKLVT